MPYIDPTPTDVKLDFPQFACVDNAVIQRRIDRTPMFVDETWLESDYTYAKELLTAYWLTDEGFGGGTDAEMASLGLSGVSRLKSGALDVTFKTGADASSGGIPAPWDANSFGRRFYALLRKNRGGVVTAAGGGCGYGAQATDLPFAWAYNGRGL